LIAVSGACISSWSNDSTAARYVLLRCMFCPHFLREVVVWMDQRGPATW
jgi:hypothetical protein